MNILSIAIGIAMAAFGIVTMYLRLARPAAFAKLKPMQEFWGKRPGYVVHVVSYSFFPIIAGAIFVYLGVGGYSLF